MSSASPKKPEKGPSGNINTPITPLKLTHNTRGSLSRLVVGTLIEVKEYGGIKF